MITLWNFNIWMTCTMVPYTRMQRLKKNVGMQYEMKKKVHIICPVITLPLCKFWRWLRSSYPGTEKGQWFTTSLEQDIQKVKNVVPYRMCEFCGQYHSQTFCIVWTHWRKEFLFNLHWCQKRKII